METSPRTGINNTRGKPPSVSTFTGYKKFYVNHIKGDPICDLKMAEVEEEDIFEYNSRLAVKKVHKRDYLIGGTKTFAATVSFMRTAFNTFQRSNRKWHNPYVGIDKVSYKSVPRDALEEEEMLALFGPGVLLSVMELAVCACMFLAGLRRAEVFALRPEDLDWKTQVIKVRRAWQNFDYKDRVMGPTKGKKERRAPFDPVLQAAIKKLWEENGQHEYVFTFKGRVTRRGTVIPAKPPGPSWIKGRFKKWLARAGIELNGRDIVPHSSRHTLATLLADRGESIKHIQELLGHSDWKTTGNYIHVTGKAIRSMGAKIEDVSRDIENGGQEPEKLPPNIIKFKAS
jgi:integrase/recombinase XerD